LDSQTLSTDFARVNKPREIEETLDTYLIRPLGYVLMRLLRGTAITPDQVSVASVVAAGGAALFYYRHDSIGAWGGLALMLLMSALDSADGQLARATGRTSDFGRLLDGICDNLSFILLYLAIWLAFMSRGGHPVLGLLLAAAAGYSHSLQSALVEFERQLFVHYCYGSTEAERERPEGLRERLAELRAERAPLLRRAMAWVHYDYSRKQRFFLRSSDQLERAYARALRERSVSGAAFAAAYRELNQSLVSRWALMASNSHKLGIVIASFLFLLFPTGPLQHLGMASYFIYDLLLNLPLLALILAQGKADRRLLATL